MLLRRPAPPVLLFTCLRLFLLAWLPNTNFLGSDELQLRGSGARMPMACVMWPADRPSLGRRIRSWMVYLVHRGKESADIPQPSIEVRQRPRRCSCCVQVIPELRLQFSSLRQTPDKQRR